MNSSFYLVMLAAFSLGLWTVFHKLASTKINPIIGAIIVSVAAVLDGVILALYQIKLDQVQITYWGVFFVVLAGVFAFGADYFILKSYGSGLEVSIVGPIVIGGSIAVASIVGFAMGDKITLLKILGILLIIGGSSILSIYA